MEASSWSQLLKRVAKVLQVARENRVIMSNKKIRCGTQVDLARIYITNANVLPDPRQLFTICQFPTPADVTGLRAFLGLVQQLKSWSPSLAEQTVWMRGLLDKGVQFKLCKDTLEE
jgi:hypothetical protein